MKRRRLIRRWIASVLFIALVAVSGYALAESGSLGNPFTVLSQISTLGANGGARGGEGRQPPADQGQDAAPRSDFGRGEQDGAQTSIQWSELGGVLSNVWFIAAASAVVMVVGPMLGFVIQRLRRMLREPRAALSGIG